MPRREFETVDSGASTSSYAFLVRFLTERPRAAYTDAVEEADARGLRIYPILFERAREDVRREVGARRRQDRRRERGGSRCPRIPIEVRDSEALKAWVDLIDHLASGGDVDLRYGGSGWTIGPPPSGEG